MRAAPTLGLLAAAWLSVRAPAETPAAESLAPAEPAPAAPLAVDASLSHATYGGVKPLLLKIKYAAAASAPAERPPLNIAVVLDRSISMAAERKLACTLDAARAVIENLSERDVVSLLAFNERVTVLSPAGLVVNKPFLLHRLEDVFAEGYSDLSGALLEALAQIKSHSADGQLRHLLLLSDGTASRGVLDEAALQKIAASARAAGIGISALGCGTQPDEKRLAAITSAGGGRYIRIETPGQIPTAFDEELGAPLPVVAQNVRIAVAVPAGGSIRKVNAEALERPGPSWNFEIGNVRAGERGVFLIELQPAVFNAGAALEARVTLTFDDPQNARRETRALAAKVLFSDNPAAENQEVVLYGAVLSALQTAQQAVQGLDIDRYQQAQPGAAALYERARRHALESKDQELLNQTFLLKHFTQEMTEASARGLLHSHAEARQKLPKDADYRRYLLLHHRPRLEAHAGPER